MRRLISMLPLVVSGLRGAGCDEDPADLCAVDAGIAPGCGLTVAGEPVRLGDPRADVALLLGDPGMASTFPGVGSCDVYSAQGLSVLYPDSGADLADALIVLDGFTGTTAEGIGIGSAEANVTAAYGTGSRDAFLGSAWHLDRGLGFEFGDGVVTRVHVIPADGDE
ncbi:MAG: hypothetical protein QGH45_11480 [Myxococcota bacterium]|nr:hypothetical protein [Myxococcota bacterium]